jgi:hypothetical protein
MSVELLNVRCRTASKNELQRTTASFAQLFGAYLSGCKDFMIILVLGCCSVSLYLDGTDEVGKRFLPTYRTSEV